MHIHVWCCSHNLSHQTNYFYMQLGVKITNFATCLPPYFFSIKKKTHRMQTSVGFSGVRYIFPSCFFIILLHRFIHYSQVLTPLPRNIFRDAPDPGLDYHSAVFPHQGIGFSEQKHNQEGYLISTFFTQSHRQPILPIPFW